jgi:hypothetical protein
MCQLHRPGKEPTVPLVARLVRPRAAVMSKSLAPVGTQTPAVQSVVRRYTD